MYTEYRHVNLSIAVKTKLYVALIIDQLIIICLFSFQHLSYFELKKKKKKLLVTFGTNALAEWPSCKQQPNGRTF